MIYNEVIGIDVSKKTLDVHIHHLDLAKKFSNSKEGFKEIVKWYKSSAKIRKLDNVLFCFENTGLYSIGLADFLEQKKYSFHIVSGLELSRSLGIVRGKTDPIDAKRIALYAFRRREELEQTTLPSKAVRTLKTMLSLRKGLVRQRMATRVKCREFIATNSKEDARLHKKILGKIDKTYTQEIKLVEQEIKQHIAENQELKKYFKLVTSVTGIGIISGAHIIAYTNCFKAFSSSRKFACYIGTAPFGRQSGTSLNSKKRTSKLGNRWLNSLMFTAASSAVQHDKQLKEYYEKKVKEGKAKMSVLNAVKNKLIHRVFTVAKRETPYVKLNHLQAA